MIGLLLCLHDLLNITGSFNVVCRIDSCSLKDEGTSGESNPHYVLLFDWAARSVRCVQHRDHQPRSRTRLHHHILQSSTKVFAPARDKLNLLTNLLEIPSKCRQSAVLRLPTSTGSRSLLSCEGSSSSTFRTTPFPCLICPLKRFLPPPTQACCSSVASCTFRARCALPSALLTSGRLDGFLLALSSSRGLLSCVATQR